MPDEPISQMIRIPTPLVDAVRELARLHRQGRTKAVLEGIERLVAAIDSGTDIDIDSVTQSISKLIERLERLEAQQSDGIPDINSATQPISNINERLEKIESVIESIALTIADLNVRLSELEGDDIATNSEAIAEPALSPQPPAPLTQSALAKRLGCSPETIKKRCWQGSKEHFAVWSRDRDPQNIAWTWEGSTRRDQRLRFTPIP